MRDAINSTSDPRVRLTFAGVPALRDEQLVAAARTGSEEAFAELTNLYSERLYTTILRITKNHEDAEDALQDTFLRVFLALSSFEGRSSFYSWVTRIAINSALMSLRKRRARPDMFVTLPLDVSTEVSHLDMGDSSPGPEEIYRQREQSRKMRDLIQKLEPKLRGPVKIWLAKECSMKEVAKAFGISMASAKSRLYRARTVLSSEQGNVHAVRKAKTSSVAQTWTPRIGPSQTGFDHQ